MVESSGRQNGKIDGNVVPPFQNLPWPTDLFPVQQADLPATLPDVVCTAPYLVQRIRRRRPN